MKKLLILSIVGVSLIGSLEFSCRQEPVAPEKEIAKRLIAQIDSFSRICDTLRDLAVGAGENGAAGSLQAMQETFLKARIAYKKFEWAAEYFDPSAARQVNGPPVQEVELSGQVFDPAGLQVIEGLLFPAYDGKNSAALLAQLKVLQGACARYKSHFEHIDILDWQVFDAVKLEVFRVISLGISGFDNPLTLKSMAESAAALSGMEEAMSHYSGSRVIGKLEEASVYLRNNPDFDGFDRARFITVYANPLSGAISDLQDSLKLHVIRYNRLLNQDARTMFDTNAFNVNAYLPDFSDHVSKEKIELGRVLFADPMLSASGTRSCRSCHQPDKAFTDGLVRNSSLDSRQLLPRNTPTLLNAALQPSQFYDMRVGTLEDQARTVVQNKLEMHGSMALSAKRLWADTGYRRMFIAAFPQKERAGIDTLEVMNALGSYIRSLVRLNSRFDEYMRGNGKAMDSSELRGLNLVMGKAKCGTCHYMPLFNGNFPPRFIKTEAEVIGVPETIGGKRIDKDPGRYGIIHVASFDHAFKTPTLRNAARTAPYMHNGVFATLDQVMDFYEKGGGAGMGVDVPNQTLPFDKLSLSHRERADIIAFIRALDSKD